MSKRAGTTLFVFNQAQDDGPTVFTNSMDFPAFIIASPRPSFLIHCRCSFDSHSHFRRLLSGRGGLFDWISKKKEPKHAILITGGCLRKPFTFLRSGAVLGNQSRNASRNGPSKSSLSSVRLLLHPC